MPGGSWSALKRKVVLGFSGCPPCAADVAFMQAARQKFQPPSYDGATHWGRLGSSVLGLDFGVVGWLGEVSTPRGGCLLFRRPVAHETVFRGESDGQEMTKKRLIVFSRLGKANTKG